MTVADGTITSAAAAGYKVVKASPFEVCLTKNGRGLRTWWVNQFKGEMPTLAHPLVQLAITINEDMENEIRERTIPE